MVDNKTIGNVLFFQLDGTSPAANTPWMPTAFEDRSTQGYGQKISLNFAIDTDSVVEITLDNGANWSALNAGNAFTAGAYLIGVQLAFGDQFNIRATAGLTLTYFRVHLP